METMMLMLMTAIMGLLFRQLPEPKRVAVRIKRR